MTPQEQQLVADLFERLSSLEGQRRDPDAERLIRDGLARAPNAVYALVQSVLVQDEALKRAAARIEELEHGGAGAEPAPSGFLDSMRNALMGGARDPSRGSVPSVRPGGQGSSGVWGPRPDASQPAGTPQQGYPQQGYPQQGYPSPMGGGMMGGGLGGGSFLGTAAATVAGVVGGAMLLNGIRSMMGGQQGFGDYSPMSPSHAASPWDSAAQGGDRGSGDLARDAGLDDIGGGNRSAASDDSGRAGFFGGGPDNPPDDQPTDDYDNAGDFGGGDSDSA
jgi:hypothetical protein